MFAGATLTIPRIFGACTAMDMVAAEHAPGAEPQVRCRAGTQAIQAIVGLFQTVFFRRKTGIMAEPTDGTQNHA